MRQFRLENETGQKYSLNGENGVWLTMPTGLGYSLAPIYSNLHHGFFERVSDDNEPQGDIVADIVFIGGYAHYKGFANYINRSIDLRIVYCADDAQEYIKRVDVITIAKGEREPTGWLRVPITFRSRTPWYKSIASVVKISGGVITGNASTYDMTYEYKMVPSDASGSITIAATGHIPSSLYIETSGALESPSIILSDTNGYEVGRMDLDGVSIESGSVLVYSSRYLDPGIWIDGVSAISYINLANENFFRVPVGDNYILSIESSGATEPNATVYIYDYYRSV